MKDGSILMKSAAIFVAWGASHGLRRMIEEYEAIHSQRAVDQRRAWPGDYHGWPEAGTERDKQEGMPRRSLPEGQAYLKPFFVLVASSRAKGHRQASDLPFPSVSPLTCCPKRVPCATLALPNPCLLAGTAHQTIVPVTMLSVPLIRLRYRHETHCIH